jgi:hypothetical protein
MRRVRARLRAVMIAREIRFLGLPESRYFNGKDRRSALEAPVLAATSS